MQKLAADTTLNRNWQDHDGYTPLNIACFEGRVSVVQFLLTLTTVDVNKPDNEGCTPFYATCQQGHKEVVSLLLADLRIDFNNPQNDGRFQIGYQGEIVSEVISLPSLIGVGDRFGISSGGRVFLKLDLGVREPIDGEGRDKVL